MNCVSCYPVTLNTGMCDSENSFCIIQFQANLIEIPHTVVHPLVHAFWDGKSRQKCHFNNVYILNISINRSVSQSINQSILKSITV